MKYLNKLTAIPWVKHKLGFILRSIVVSTIRMHLVSIACIFFATGNYLMDFFLHSFLTIFLYRCLTYMVVVVVKEHSKSIDNAVLFIIDNYEDPAFKFSLLSAFTLYGLLALRFIVVNNFIVSYLLIQNFFIFISNDLLFENPHIITSVCIECKKKIRDPARVISVKKPENVVIVENHFTKPPSQPRPKILRKPRIQHKKGLIKSILKSIKNSYKQLR